MIDVRLLKENKEFYSTSFKNKGLDLDNEIEKVINLYNEYHTLLQEEEKARIELKEVSSKIKEDPSMKEEAQKISAKAKELTTKVNELDSEIKEIASYFPNPSFEDVPVGKSEDDNVEISSHMDDKKENPYAKPHWEIIEEQKHVLLDEASYNSGARHVVYNGDAALVVKALERFMIDNAMEDGHKLVEAPLLVNEEAMFNTGQLPKFADDAYKVGDQYLIPTSEVSVTNLSANKIYDEAELPIKYVSASNCFRKEAGSAGKDTRGIIRLHQFRKVELVKFGKQEDLNNDFDTMLKTSTNLLDKLELPYRLLQLCTGDASFTAAKTVDIEVWMPGVNTYREISSVSACTDFQARRLKARYKDQDGKKKLIYTYNGSALAIERTFAAILENYIQENGKVKVPNALRPYLPFEEF